MNAEQPNLLEDPRAAIEAIRAQIMALGANDSESAALDAITKKFLAGGYTNPNDAIEAAQAVLLNKQDYH